MPYVTAEEICTAREIDLLTYLQCTSPQELVALGNGNYCTREHDSLKISNGLWHWFSRGIGGKSAVDYLIKVEEMDFVSAVKAVLGNDAHIRLSTKQKVTTPKIVLLPEKNENSEIVVKYLRGRGISENVINYCLKKELLYESQKYHNAVFVGYDSRGVVRYAAIRGTSSPYKGEASGSDKHFSFQLGEGTGSVHLFEAAIDVLSYATLLEMHGVEWQKRSLLSLAGVFKTKREDVVPVALQRYLFEHPQIHTIYLHLDNDETGRGAAAGIISGLKEKYEVVDAPSPEGKDINDYLLIQRKTIKDKEDHER